MQKAVRALAGLLLLVLIIFFNNNVAEWAKMNLEHKIRKDRKKSLLADDKKYFSDSFMIQLKHTWNHFYSMT